MGPSLRPAYLVGPARAALEEITINSATEDTKCLAEPGAVNTASLVLLILLLWCSSLATAGGGRLNALSGL